jgi:tetratricopeptide (TPR) repeat protein
MRRVATLCCGLSLLVAGLAGSARGDAIHLKNGDVIYADEVNENGNQVVYQRGEDSYTIPKSLVVKIEKTEAGPPGASASAGSDLPAYAPADRISGYQDHLLERIVTGGHVDREALSKIELNANPGETAIAFYMAGKQEYQSGDYSAARRDFETALRNDHNNPAILNFYAALLVKTGDPRQALIYAQRAVEQAPDSADAYAVLGYAQFASDRIREAIQSWKKSLALRPDDSIRQLLARAERESSIQGNFSERETGHFVLQYDGAQSSEALRAQILATLDAAYKELSREFGGEPRASIEVVLYTRHDFFDVTRAPSWMGALNDGKIRIPLRGVDSVTPMLARILRHELVHSFVNQATLGRCPAWLNEGIAQMLEPRPVEYGPALARLFKSNKEIPLNTLDAGFASLPGNLVELAYAESLATVTYIRDRYGMSDILRVLDLLAHGESIESALRSAIHCDYASLQDETGTALVRQFGS